MSKKKGLYQKLKRFYKENVLGLMVDTAEQIKIVDRSGYVVLVGIIVGCMTLLLLPFALLLGLLLMINKVIS